MLRASAVAIVVLAAGKGSRMQSKTAKVLHKIHGKPIIFYTLETLSSLVQQDQITVVVGTQARKVVNTISAVFKVQFAQQDQPLGTNHALQSALPFLKDSAETVLCLNGDDSAFYSRKTLKDFIGMHDESKATVSLITKFIDEDNIRLGRIIRYKNGQFRKVMQLPQYLRSQSKSLEINCGAYVFQRDWLEENIKKVRINADNEYPVTDLLNRARSQNVKISLFTLKKTNEWIGINTKDELKYARKIMKDTNG